MIPPRGFKSELYPLRHRIIYSFGLSLAGSTINSAMATLVRHYKTVLQAPSLIEVNPHNTLYDEETGAVVQKMSIIDKLRLSIKFNMTENCKDGIDAIWNFKFLWRPIFFSFPEKLDAVDDDTSTDVKTILQLTKDATEEDIVPISTAKLPVVGTSDLSQPLSTVNLSEVATTHYNMTTDATMEGLAWDETLFQDAIRRYTNKGALKACVGRTRHVILSSTKPWANVYLDKFVPRAIRRVMPYTFMAILVHLPLIGDIGQVYQSDNPTSTVAHLGCKIIAQYHEWNADHHQDMTGAGA